MGGRAPSATGPLIGRAQDVAELRAIVDAGFEHGAAGILRGAAGVGKTRLLEEASEYAAALGARVLWGSGAQFEAELSFAVMHQLVEPLFGGLEALPGVSRAALESALGLGEAIPTRPLAVYSALLSLLTSTAGSQPLLVVVDDLHWVDASSAAAIDFVARRVKTHPIALLGALRTGERTRFDGNGIAAVDLYPLARHDAEQLILSRFPQLPGNVRQELVEEAAGYPLALVEWGASLDHSRDYGQAPSLETLSLPGRLEASFASRIAELSAPTRKAMLMLALDGRSGLRELAEVGVSMEDLAEAETAGTVVVDSTAGTVRFRHPLMRSALVGAATSVERRRVHRELADHLDGDPDRRAWHLANAATGTDDDVAQLLDDLSRRSFARGDAVGATTAILRAAGLSSRAEDRSRRLSEAAFLSADVTGEFGQASTLLADARGEVGHGAGSMYAAAASAQLAVNSGANLSAALKLIEDAVSTGEHGWSADDQELMATMRTWLHLCSYAGDPASWQAYFDSLARLVPEPADLLAESGALGDPARRGRDARITLERLARELDADTDPTIILSATLSAMYIDMVDPYRPSAWRFVAAGRDGGAPRPYARSLIHLAVDDVWRGAWERALTLSAEGAVLCAQNGFDNGAWCSDYIDSMIAAARGDVTVARAWAAEHNKTWIACQAWGVQRFSHQPLILAAEADGNWEETYRLACQLSPPGVFAPYVPQATWVAFDLVEAAARTGRTVEAEAHARAMADAQLGQVSGRLGLLTGAAVALVDDGPEWRESFEAALRYPDAGSWPFDLARVRLVYGERLRKAGDLVRAREVLHDALESFERLEARPWANRTKAELRSAGDPLARMAVPLGAGLVSLTPQEWSVAELAATGLSNREIADRLYLSPRTVSGHLYNIFPKLGISSRAALRDAIAQLTA